MFAIAARRLGYRVHTFSPDSDTPTGQVADVEWRASYENVTKIKAFAKAVDAVTFEFENVPSACLAAIESAVPVRPRREVLYITQNRLREKTFLQKNGFPVTPFCAIGSEEDLEKGMKRLGAPAVLKTAGFGYDGKGQKKITSIQDAKTVYRSYAGVESILEGFVDFKKELSVVAARGADGQFAAFGVMENHHTNHILDITICPARISPRLARDAVQVAEGIFEALRVVGVMCVEMFLTKKGKILVNELAPRPHNSGHLTFDACVTSQFEQQLRAVCGLPLGSAALLKPAAMANLLGDLWANGEPKWERALKDPDIKLHLYGKHTARLGRKMGHLTAMAETSLKAREKVLRARERLLD